MKKHSAFAPCLCQQIFYLGIEKPPYRFRFGGLVLLYKVNEGLWPERHSRHLFCPSQEAVAYEDALFTSKPLCSLLCDFITFSATLARAAFLRLRAVVVLWQAWRSPASLGFPLSIPSACGCHEIDHLKVPPYPMYIITCLVSFVKHFFCSQVTFVSFFFYF